MARKTAGAKYPHASSTARVHDHQWCPVVGTVAERVAAGSEEWGTAHPLPPQPADGRAVLIRQGLFRGRDCAKLKKQHGELSVSVTYQREDGTLSNTPVLNDGKHVLVVRVWSRDIAKKEIAGRVGRGERLHYNVLKGSD
jgi:hypothetical protein